MVMFFKKLKNKKYIAYTLQNACKTLQNIYICSYEILFCQVVEL